jgi:polysaccharide deacetylase family sporulation protein PdaB
MEQQVHTQSEAALFVKVGILVLSLIAFIGLGVKFVPDAISVSNIGRKRDLPIYCVNTEENKLALTFDTAWGNEDIPVILDILKEYQVRATFFVTGEWVNRYPEDVKRIAKAGHDLGNHSENHKQMTRLTEEECKQEILTVHQRVKKLTGIEMNLFRPPYGDYNNAVVGTARACGYDTIQWDVDSLDWKDYGVKSIIDKTVNHKKLGKGSIILMHTGTKYTAESLAKVIQGLREKGYELVPVSELIYRGDYEVDRTGRQIRK